MSVVWRRASAELRRRWAATLLLVLLVALAGGVVMTAAAGARRTASAYTRMLEASNAGDVLVNPADGNTDLDAIEALPGVADAARGYGQFVTRIAPDGGPDFSTPWLPISTDGGLGYELDRPVNMDGRLPDPDREDEIFLSRPVAEELGYEVGDELELLAFSDEATPPEQITFRLVGIGLFPQDALQDLDSGANFSLLLLSPAYHETHSERLEGLSFIASLVDLEDGASLERFLADAQRVAGEKLYLQTTAESTAKAQRALRPYVVALGAFAAVAGLAALLVLGQALTRQLLTDAGDAATLVALGMTKRQLAAGVLLRAAAVGVAGAALAAALAYALSPLLPIGPARDIDPDPGIALDGLVLGLGALGLAVLVVAWGAAVAWRLTRTSVLIGAPAPAARSRLAGLLSGLGMPPTSSAGVRMALEPGGGATSVPVRTTMVGAVLGLAALVAALTFGAGLDRFLDTPRLYGWDWDAMVRLDVDQEDPEALAGEVLAGIESVPAVDAVTPGSYGQLLVDGVTVAAVGIGQDGEAAVHPPLLEGRPATRGDEIVLGTTTLRRIGRDVGDTVEVVVGQDRRSAEVVGRAVFPRLSQYPGADKTGMGDGAAMTTEALAELIPENELGFFLIDLAEGTGTNAALAELRAAVPPIEAQDEDPVVVLPQRPDDLVGYEDVNGTPVALAALLAVLAGATTAHGLVLATRRRRRDLALLKTMGFTRRQVSATVAWQATVVAVVALVVGLPLGVAFGRLAWSSWADRLGTAAEPVTPVLAVVLAVPVALVLFNVVAALPARAAARTRPAIALRSE